MIIQNALALYYRHWLKCYNIINKLDACIKYIDL